MKHKNRHSKNMKPLKLLAAALAIAALVKELRLADIRHIYEVIGGLEGVALVSVAERLGSDQLARMRALNKEMVEQTVAFIKDLSFSKNASSFKEVINQISDGLSTDIELEVLKLDYLADGIQMKMFGRVNASFRRAQKEYRDFIGHLKWHGYVVEESRFDTEIKESRFIINLKKRVR